jgi:hypothetical protein
LKKYPAVRIPQAEKSGLGDMKNALAILSDPMIGANGCLISRVSEQPSFSLT